LLVCLTLAFACLGTFSALLIQVALKPFSEFGLGRVYLISEATASNPSNPYSTVSRSLLLSGRVTSVEPLGKVQFQDLYVKVGGGTEATRAALVRGPLVRRFGGRLIAGRDLADSDGDWIGVPAVLLGERYWRSHFGADPRLERLSVRTADTSAPELRVVGVLAELPAFGYFTAGQIDLVLPMRAGAREYAGKNQSTCLDLVRLRRGVTIETAERELAVQTSALKALRQLPGTSEFRLRPASALFAASQRTLRAALLAAGIAFLLALFCTAAVLQVRTIERTSELAVRQALGATGLKNFAMLARESVALFVVTGTAGSLLAGRILAWFGAEIQRGFGLAGALEPWQAAWLPFLAVLLTPLLGLVLAVAQAPVAASALRSGMMPASRGSWTARRVLVRRSLVFLQIGIAALLALAGVAATRSLWAAERRDLGFDVRRTFSARVTLLPVAGDSPQRWDRFYTSLVADLTRAAGIGSVAVKSREIAGPPLLQLWKTPGARAGEEPVTARLDMVHPSYFAQMNLRATTGRVCADNAWTLQRETAVLNEAAARRYWPAGDAVGRRIGPGFNGPIEIVGVVPARANALLEDRPVPEVLHCAPFPQMHVLVSHTGAMSGVLDLLRQEARRLDADAMVDQVERVENLLAAPLRPLQTVVAVLSGFGTVAALIAGLALFSITALALSTRRKELAVRVALGADPARLSRAVATREIGIGLAGLAAGWVAYLAVVQRFAPAWGVPLDLPPMTAVCVMATLLAMVSAAVWAPARRLRSVRVSEELSAGR
jgi:hypothetical protein